MSGGRLGTGGRFGVGVSIPILIAIGPGSSVMRFVLSRDVEIPDGSGALVGEAAGVEEAEVVASAAMVEGGFRAEKGGRFG